MKSYLLFFSLCSSLAYSQTPTELQKIVAIQQAEISSLRTQVQTLLSNQSKLSGSIQEAKNDEFYQVADNSKFSAAGTFLLTVTTRSSSVPGRGKVAQFAVSPHMSGSNSGVMISSVSLNGALGGSNFTATDSTPGENNISVKVANIPGGTWKLSIGHQHGEIQSMGYQISAYSN